MKPLLNDLFRLRQQAAAAHVIAKGNRYFYS